MKHLLLALALFAAISLPAEAAKVKRPKWAPGCRNEVLKRGYEMYMTPRVLGAMIAVMLVEPKRFYDDIATTRDVYDKVWEMMVLPEDDGTTNYALTRLVYPLQDKGFLYTPNELYGGSLIIESHVMGRLAAKQNIQTFWEVYLRSCEQRGKTPETIKSLTQNAPPRTTPPAMELADYLVLSLFMRGAHLGSTEVYDVVKEDLSYYKEFFPTNTPSSVLARLRSYEARGWLAFEGSNRENYANGGSLYQFSITPAGREAFRNLETFYLRLVSYYISAVGKTAAREALDM